MKFQLTCVPPSIACSRQQALPHYSLGAFVPPHLANDMNREKGRLGRVDGMNCGLQVPKMWLEMQSALAVVILVA